MPHILAFPGGARRAYHNRKLIRIAAEWARFAGGEVTLVELTDIPMPIFNDDLEAAGGLPEHCRAFKQVLLTNLDVMVLPGQQALDQAETVFAGDGALVDEHRQKKVEQLGAELVRIVDRLHFPR